MKTIADRCPNILESLTEDSKVKAGLLSSYSEETLSLTCYICESVFSVKAKSLTNKILARCFSCRFTIPKGDSFLERYPKISSEWSFENRTTLDKVWFQSEEKFLWICALGHVWKDTPLHRSLGRQCIQCYGRKQPNDSGSLSNKFPELLKEWSSKNTLDPRFITYGSNLEAIWVCSKDHEWTARVCSRTRAKSTGCPECSLKNFQSKGEREIVSFIDSLGVSGQTSVRDVIAPYELDFYSESLGIAVEFNGDYFHSESIIKERHNISSFEYHSRKKDLCSKVGVSLYYVWESDWMSKNDEIKEALSNLFLSSEASRILNILSKG